MWTSASPRSAEAPAARSPSHPSQARSSPNPPAPRSPSTASTARSTPRSTRPPDSPTASPTPPPAPTAPADARSSPTPATPPTKSFAPLQWPSQTHVEDTRKGGRWDSYINPENYQSPGIESGQSIDVVSTRSGAALFQLNGTQSPASVGLAVSDKAPTGGSNLYPKTIDGTVPYFKSGYSALTVNGTYNTQGQHVLVPRLASCYGVGDCLIGSEYLVSSGGFRDEADEGTHPQDIQILEDTLVFDGTCTTAALPALHRSQSLPPQAPAPRATAVSSSTPTQPRSSPRAR